MFEKVFCLNLEKRTDRWEECQEEFKKLPWHVERFAGIDGDFNLSQYKVIKEASKYKSSLILEDDVFFTGEADLTDLPKDWDLVCLGANLLEPHTKKVSDGIYEYRNGLTTHAIGYSQKMMQHIVKTYNPKGVVFDEWLRQNVLKSDRFNTYIANPMVAFQRSSFSDLQGRFVDYTKFFDKSKTMLQ